LKSQNISIPGAACVNISTFAAEAADV